MKIIAFYFVLLTISLFHISISMEELLDFESLRPGCIFEKAQIDSLPKLTSAKDCYELCHSLIQNEISFWQDSQKHLIAENTRLAIILKLLGKSEGSHEVVKQGKLAPLDLTKKLNNLELREKIFINPRDPSDTTNKDLYDIYKSYNVIETKLHELSLQYEKCRSILPTETDQIEFLEKVKITLNQESRKITNDLLFIRGILQSNSIGKSIPQIINSQKGQFQADVGTKFGCYAYCDVEYISEIILPTLNDIIKTTQETLALKKQSSQSKQTLNTQLKTRKRQSKKRRAKASLSSSSKDKVVQQELVDQKTEMLQDIDLTIPVIQPQSQSQPQHQPLKFDSSMHSGVGLTHDSLPVQNTISELSPHSVQPEVLVVERKVSLPTDGSRSSLDTVVDLGPMVPQQEKEEVKNAQEDAHDVGYDLKPWEQYAKKTSANDSGISTHDHRIPLFVLNVDDLYTAKLLLGLLDNGREKLEMTSFMTLVKVGLKGAVIDRKKCIYFMAPSIVDQTWCSVAMHRLHKDDSHIIPRNTRYWKIARQLLLDVGLNELLFP